MVRVAFRLRVRAECIDAYEAAHRRVWPELLRVIKSVGIRQYSIFRLGRDLFFYMHVDNFERAWSELDRSEINLRWQREMARFFEPTEDAEPGDRFPMMREVFHLD
jgi:L-rhamnose mutarotase